MLQLSFISGVYQTKNSLLDVISQFMSFLHQKLENVKLFSGPRAVLEAFLLPDETKINIISLLNHKEDVENLWLRTLFSHSTWNSTFISDLVLIYGSNKFTFLSELSRFSWNIICFALIILMFGQNLKIFLIICDLRRLYRTC